MFYKHHSSYGTDMARKTVLTGDRSGFHLTLCLPVSSADNIDKHFGPRSGPINRWG